MAVLFANNVSTTLAAPVATTDTTIAVTSSSGMPTISSGDYFLLTLENVAGNLREIVKVTAFTGSTLTVVRAQEGTSALSFSSGDKVELRLTAGGLTNIFTDITAALQTINGV